MELEIRLLGTLEANLGGQPVDLGGPRQRSVLALLLVARGAAVSVDRLIEDLWQGEAPQRATASLQAYVSNLRRALEPDRPPRTPAQLLVSAPPGYAVRLGDDAVDAWRFERLLRQAGELADPVVETATLEQALALWQGAALAEFATDPWAAPEAARLEQLRGLARERLVDARIRAGAAAVAVVEAEALVRDAPLREEGWRLLALAQYAAGRQADALGTLREARRLLADELGIDPGPRLTALERDVLAQAVVLAEPQAERLAARARPLPPSPPLSGPANPPAPVAFFGRTVERAALRDAAHSAEPGRTVVTLLAGEAGGGKSALLARLRDDLGADGWRVAVGRCPEDDGGLPARAWLEALRGIAAELGGAALPEVLAHYLADDWTSSGPANVLVERFRLHRAIHDWLASLTDRPLAVLLDDVHRADFETRALLSALLDHGLPGRVVFVLAYRPEPTEPLEDVLASVAPHAPTRVRLAGLGAEDAARLIASVTGQDADPATVEALTARTDGNPFYLTESARLLASEGEVVATSQVPEGVSDVLRRRLARLPAEAVSVLRLASVIGRDVDISLLVRAAELGEDAVLDALEVGVISGLLLEPAPGGVRFSHLLVRETLYAGVPQLRRTRWHARVAQAVAELYPADVTALAHHSARAATPETARRAAERCIAAAEVAESRFSFDSAAEFYAEGQRCLELLTPPDTSAVVDMMTRRVQALVRAGSTAAAARIRREASFRAATTDDGPLLARAVSCGTLPAMRPNLRPYGTYDAEFVALIERVLDDPTVPENLRSLTLSTFVRETSETGNPRTEPAYVEAREIGYRLGDPVLIGMALWAGGEVYYPDRHLEQREQIAREIQRVGEEYDLPVFQVLGHVVAVYSLNVRLEWADARWHAEQAGLLARKFQLRQGIFISNVLLAMIEHATGDPEKAAHAYQDAFEAQRSVGSVDADAALLLALTTVRASQGRLAELIGDLRLAYRELLPAIGHLLAFALAESGQPEEARRVLAEVPPLVEDYIWPVLACMRARTLATLGITEGAAELYRALLPYTGQVAGAGTTGFVLMPIDGAAGHLAVLLGRPQDALSHFEQALVVAEKCGSPSWIELARADLVSVGSLQRN